MNKYLFLSGFVLKTKFVKTLSIVRGCARFDIAQCVVLRQFVMRHLLRVIYRTHYDRLIRIAVLEFDQYLLADPRDEHRAPLVSRDARTHPKPARGTRVICTLPVPVKLNFYAAELVGVYLFSSRADHDGGYRTVNGRLRSHVLRLEIQKLHVTLSDAFELNLHQTIKFVTRRSIIRTLIVTEHERGQGVYPVVVFY